MGLWHLWVFVIPWTAYRIQPLAAFRRMLPMSLLYVIRVLVVFLFCLAAVRWNMPLPVVRFQPGD